MALTLDDVTITAEFAYTMTDANDAVSTATCTITDNTSGKTISFAMPAVPTMQDYALGILSTMVEGA